MCNLGRKYLSKQRWLWELEFLCPFGKRSSHNLNDLGFLYMVKEMFKKWCNYEEQLIYIQMFLFFFFFLPEPYSNTFHLLQYLNSKSFSHVWLCDSVDYTVHGIAQARILEWVFFSRGSSLPRDWTQVSCIADGFFTSRATREAQEYWGG